MAPVTTAGIVERARLDDLMLCFVFQTKCFDHIAKTMICPLLPVYLEIFPEVGLCPLNNMKNDHA